MVLPPGIDDLLADIERFVCVESPSADLDAVSRSADAVADLGVRHFGVEPERIRIDGRTHLRWRFGATPRVLVLGHHDTVWPIGCLDTRPYEIRDGVMRGPGCFDMKTGVVMAFHALAALDDLDGVSLLVTADEELGSPTSRQLIEDEARGCAAALVLEGAGPGSALITERKGVSIYEVLLHGRAAHAGREPERGVNATIEAAHQILTIAALGDTTAGTTVTPTALNAGTTTNTVPARGRFSVDVRVRTDGEQQRVHAAMRALRARLPESRVEVIGGPNRPPLPASASQRLFARASHLAVAAGAGPLAAVTVGGASDGNFTAGVGTPTLDGLGAVGGGAHADDEHVIVAELPRRTALLRAIVTAVLAADQVGPTTVATPSGLRTTEERSVDREHDGRD